MKTLTFTFTLEIENIERASEATNEVANGLEKITELLRDGYTSGIDPNWDLVLTD